MFVFAVLLCAVFCWEKPLQMPRQMPRQMPQPIPELLAECADGQLIQHRSLGVVAQKYKPYCKKHASVAWTYSATCDYSE